MLLVYCISRETLKIFYHWNFVKSSKSMLKVYFSEVLKKYTSQKHERSTKKVYFLEAWKKY